MGIERIILITDQFPPEIGSAANLFDDLGISLLKRKIQVDILTLIPKSYRLINKSSMEPYRHKIFHFEIKNGLNIYRIRGFPIPKDNLLLRGLDHFSTAFLLFFRGVFLKKPQIILVYSPPLPLALTCIILSKIRRCKVIINIQDLYPQTIIDLGLINNSILIDFFKIIEKFVYLYSDYLVVHSESNKKYLVTHGAIETNVEVIYNWIDIDVIKPTEREPFFQGIELKNKFIVSYAGVFSPHQGLGVILDAAIILKENEDILFLIAGDGFTRENLLEKARENGLSNVKFLSFLSKYEYIKFLACSDVSLVCLDKEVKTPVVPGKLMSIMACGRTVIAAVPSVSDTVKIIKDSQCGIVIDAGDSKSLADSIQNLKLNPDLMEIFGRNGRKYAEMFFSLTEGTNKYVEIFNRLQQKNSKKSDKP